MGTTMTPKTEPQPGMFTVSVEDISQFRNFKKAISMMRGVVKVSIPRKKRQRALEQSQRDIAAGRIEKFSSSEEMFHSLGI